MIQVVCAPKPLPPNLWAAAATQAININPLNYAPLHRLTALITDFQPTRERIAVLTTKYRASRS